MAAESAAIEAKLERRKKGVLSPPLGLRLGLWIIRGVHGAAERAAREARDPFRREEQPVLEVAASHERVDEARA